MEEEEIAFFPNNSLPLPNASRYYIYRLPKLQPKLKQLPIDGISRGTESLFTVFFAQKKDKYGNGGLKWTKGNASEGVSVFLPGNKGEGEGGEGQSPKVSAMKERERELAHGGPKREKES